MRQAEPVAPCPGMNPLSEKAGMLRILTFSTLFPHGQAPGFGRFVADQSVQLARQPDCAVKVVAPLPRRPLLPRRFQPLADLPLEEEWEGMAVHRPRFTAPCPVLAAGITPRPWWPPPAPCWRRFARAVLILM